MNRIIILFSSILSILLFISLTLFIVNERNFVIVCSFGKIKRVIDSPGLYFKMLPPFENIFLVDKRIRSTNISIPNVYITAEKKILSIQPLLEWRVSNIYNYFINFHENNCLAEDQLKKIVNFSLNEILSKNTVHEIISSKSEIIKYNVLNKAIYYANNLGIKIIDIHFKRINFLTNINKLIHQKMIAERRQIANQLRYITISEAEQIRAYADLQCEKNLTNAYKNSQIKMGEGDAQAISIYGKTFSKNPDFYKFYKSLEIYSNTCTGTNNIIVTTLPNSLIRLFNKIHTYKIK